MKLIQALNHYAQALSAIYDDRQHAIRIIWWLLQKATNSTQAELITTSILSDHVLKQVDGWINEIIYEHKPVQYILGTVPFLNLELIVRPPVLIPRPETEEWADLLIKRLSVSSVKKFNLLDVCTGTGCIALALARAFPQAFIIASDNDEDAGALAKKNADYNKIDNCAIYRSDLFDQLPQMHFSVITANPPYISLEEWTFLDRRVKNWESPQALIAQKEGTALLECIIQKAPYYLDRDKKIPGVAQLWLEIGSQQADKVATILHANEYKDITVLKDSAGKNRVVTGNI